MPLIISLLAILSVTLLVRSILRGDKVGGYVFKPLSTALIIALSLVSFTRPEVNLYYALIITLGQFLSLAGDITLILPFSKALAVGMLFFLFTHLLYGIGFLRLNGFQWPDLFSGLMILLFGLIIYTLLYSNLGKMRVPVTLPHC